MAKPNGPKTMEQSAKRGRGRPPGSTNKIKKGIRDTSEFRAKLLGSLSDKDIEKLPADLKARLASTLVPRERPQVEEKSQAVKFLMFGVRETTCPHEGCDIILPEDVISMILTGKVISCPGCNGTIPTTGKSPVPIPRDMVLSAKERGK